MDLRVLPVDSVPRTFREPFIQSGYRPIGIKILSCVKSAFKSDHNEFLNFWTHFLPAIIWLSYLLQNKIDYFIQPKYMPIVCCWLGGIFYTFLSSFAHLFNVISHNFTHLCFFLDYTGIALYEMGSIIASYYYYRPLHLPIFKYELTYLTIAVLFTLLAVLINCLSRFYLLRYCYIVRSLSYFLPIVWGYIPTITLFLYPDESHEFLFRHINVHFSIVFLTLLLLFFFASKVPERFSPGKFDLIGNSHQCAHICAVAITTLQFWIMETDMENRWAHLSHQEIQPNFNKTIGLFILCSAGMIGISLFVSVFVYTGRLETENTSKQK